MLPLNPMSLSYAVANPELPLIYSVKIGQLFNANGFFIIKAVILLLEYAPNLSDYVYILFLDSIVDV